MKTKNILAACTLLAASLCPTLAQTQSDEAKMNEISGVSRPTVYNLLKKKEFRWIQLDGGKYRISKKSFDDWLDKLEE